MRIPRQRSMLRGGPHDLELTIRRHTHRAHPWDRITEPPPGRDAHVIVTAKDNRLFEEATLSRYRATIPRPDLPERRGDPETIHTRFSRWANSGALGERL